MNNSGGGEERVEPERMEAPFTVNLTDRDTVNLTEVDFTAIAWENGTEA